MEVSQNFRASLIVQANSGEEGCKVFFSRHSEKLHEKAR